MWINKVSVSLFLYGVYLGFGFVSCSTLARSEGPILWLILLINLLLGNRSGMVFAPLLPRRIVLGLFPTPVEVVNLCYTLCLNLNR